jgi:hypothetical protein
MTMRNRLARLEANAKPARLSADSPVFDAGELSEATRAELAEALDRQPSRPIDVTRLSDTALQEIAATWRDEK